jgi:RHS repeat-associated protein
MNEAEMGWTRSKSINTGKHSEVETFNGASLPAPWGTNTSSTGKVQTDIDGERTLVTDQSGKQRISKTNALGQLLNVWEVKDADADTEAVTFGSLSLNALKTSYQYDTLNNLITVNQGVQTRSFAYNSLSRLKSANNPESGLISYKYDDNGNLTSKTDARSITTNYVYDVLHRVKNRNYSDGTTPNVAYTYDNGTNAKGKLTKVTTAPTATNQLAETKYNSFDILGRVLSHSQITDGQTYNSSYLYNLSGALIEETYPSGRVVKNTLDIDGDLAQVQSKKLNGTLQNHANAFTYTSAGAVSSLRLGNGKFENTTFNSRLQPTQIGLGSSATSQNLLKLNFDYGLADNNGNVKSQTITTPTVGTATGFTAIQTYSYDSLNRLKDAKEMIGTAQQWKQTFKYDRYGNREFDTQNNNTTTLANGCPVAVCNPQASPTNNKLVGTTYDDAGNTKIDASNQSYVYDAENKQVQVNNASGIVGQYYYDGDGKRIKKFVPSTSETTIFVYDASGKMVAEYSTITASQSEAKISYLTNDHLGSPRITTDSLGKVVSRRDFMPFGEEVARASNGGDSVRQKFTGYERDGETGLDYAKARMFGSGVGRFTSPDNFLNDTHASSPQKWNLYTYVSNNPLKYVDPSGAVEKDPVTGKVKFVADGKTETQTATVKISSTDSSGKTTSLTLTITGQLKSGTIYADDKTAIQAFQSGGPLTVKATNDAGDTLYDGDIAGLEKLAGGETILSGWNNVADCHGTSFANGEVWINNDQVEKLMIGDGYDVNNPSSVASDGAVGIFSTDGTLANARHSVRVTDPGSSGKNIKNGDQWYEDGTPVSVESKGGMTSRVITSPAESWTNTKPERENHQLKYYTKKVTQ